jgi:hypothetical protein
MQANLGALYKLTLFNLQGTNVIQNDIFYALPKESRPNNLPFSQPLVKTFYKKFYVFPIILNTPPCVSAKMQKKV